MITYTKNADGTFTKAGEFAAVPVEVLIQIGDAKPFSSTYTLQAATTLIEDAIKKNQVKADVYRILPIQEKIGKTKAPREPKAAKEPKAPKVPKEKKYSNEKFVEIYKASNNSLDEVCKQTGASRVWAQRVLVKLGVYVKPIKAAKPEVVLTSEEETRVAQLLLACDPASTGPVADLLYPNRAAAIKQLRKEQRIAARPAREPKGPRVTKYSKQDFVDAYLVNHSLDEVCAKTGASRVWAQRVLVKLGVWVAPVKPIKADKPASVPDSTPGIVAQ